MRLSDRYVFGELIVPFFIGTLAVLLMLIGNTLFAYLSRMLQEHWPVGVVLRALVLNIPTVLVLTLPVATALAASMATGRLARDNEITVMRGVGAPLRRVLAPVLVFGALVGLLAFWISDRVVPWAFQEQQGIESLLYNLPKNPIEPDVAFKVENKYAFWVKTAQRTDDNGLLLRKVVMLQLPQRADDDFGTWLTAETAKYKDDVFTFRDVVLHRFAKNGEPGSGVDGKSPSAKLRVHVNFSQVMSPPLSEDKLAFAELTQRARDARALGQKGDALRYEVERWFKLSLPAMCFVFALCAPPLALRFSRTGGFAGVLLSIIVVFVAWNTLLLMKYVGLGGLLPPVVAAWSTNVLFTLLGLWLLRTQE